MRDVLMRCVMEGRRTYSDAQALEWLLGVGEAVTALHEAEPPIIHRDIKQVSGTAAANLGTCRSARLAPPFAMHHTCAHTFISVGA